MFATSRNRRTRVPLADTSMFSAAFEPLKSIASVPRLALDRVAAVARIPDERVVARTTDRHVVAAVAVDRVVPVTAQQRVVTVTAAERVVAGAAVDGQRPEPRHAVARVDGVVTATGLNVDRMEGAAVEAEIDRAVLTDVERQSAAVGHAGRACRSRHHR